MGQLRNKFCLHFFILGNLAGHLVDGIRQFADLIFIGGFDLNTVASAGNALGLLRDLSHGVHDGF